MNTIKLLLVSVLFFGYSFVAQAQDITIKRAESAIKIGSAKDLSNLFNENVEIILNGKKSNYSKTQAELVMKNFFSEHVANPAGFQNYHRGQSSNNLNYSIIRYASKNAGYRVFLKIKQYQGRYVIDSIDMTKE